MIDKFLITPKMLVIDVEATCWEGYPPAGQTSEIIEVGICEIDTVTLRKTDSESILIKPRMSTVSEFCTNLTGLEQKDLADGNSFKEVCQILQKDYNSKNVTWVSYGDYDMNKFRSQCRAMNVPYPFSENHINVKQVIADMLGVKPMGMDRMLGLLNMSLDGVHHRGEDDACNIAKILLYILERQ